MFFCYVNYTISTKREKQNKKTQREKWELSPLTDWYGVMIR